jgi:hypothetical protein
MMSPCGAQEPRPIRAVPYSRQPPELDLERTRS